MWPGSSGSREAGTVMMTFSDAGSMSLLASTVKRETRLKKFAGSLLLAESGA